MKTRLLVTDMDGTVVDSMDFLRELAVSLLVADEQPEDWARHLYDQTFGKPISEQYTEWNHRHGHLSGHEISVRKFTRVYEAVHILAARNFPITDFGRSLECFRADLFPNWRFALVTSTHRRIVEKMPQIRRIHWDFMGGFEGPGSEKIEQIRLLRERLGISWSDVVYVGDAPSDKDIATQLGIMYKYPSALTLQEVIQAFSEDPATSQPTQYGTVVA